MADLNWTEPESAANTAYPPLYPYNNATTTASGHSLEYIGSGTNIASALPAAGGVPIQENEVDMKISLSVQFLHAPLKKTNLHFLQSTEF